MQAAASFMATAKADMMRAVQGAYKAVSPVVFLTFLCDQLHRRCGYVSPTCLGRSLSCRCDFFAVGIRIEQHRWERRVNTKSHTLRHQLFRVMTYELGSDADIVLSRFMPFYRPIPKWNGTSSDKLYRENWGLGTVGAACRDPASLNGNAGRGGAAPTKPSASLRQRPKSSVAKRRASQVARGTACCSVRGRI